jgi:hypothetical protein
LHTDIHTVTSSLYSRWISPATQIWKRQRLADAGIAVPRSTRYVPVDFERQTAFDALAHDGLSTRRHQRSFRGWA